MRFSVAAFIFCSLLITAACPQGKAAPAEEKPAEELFTKIQDRYSAEISAIARLLISDTSRIVGFDAQYARFSSDIPLQFTFGFTFFGRIENVSVNDYSGPIRGDYLF